MPDTYHDIEDRISEAVKSLDSQGKPNVAKTARDFRVPPSRLRNRWNGRRSKSQVVAHNRTLSEAQELTICQYLDHLDRGGPKAQYNQLKQAANAFLKKDYTGKGKPPTVGSHWAGQFLQRHSQYFVRKQKSLATERKNAYQPITIQTHFNDFQAAKIEKGIHDHDCYNFDETGFRIGVGQDQWVITKNELGRLYMENPENCEYLSSLECIGRGGDVLPNMLILSGQQHLEKWVEENNLDDDVALAVSDNGYSNDEISLE